MPHFEEFQTFSRREYEIMMGLVGDPVEFASVEEFESAVAATATA